MKGDDLTGSYLDFSGTASGFGQWTHIPAEDAASTLLLDAIFSIIGVNVTTNANLDSTVAELRIKAAAFRSVAVPRLLRKNDAFLSPADPSNGKQARYIVTEVPQDDGFGELVVNMQKMTRTKSGDN